MKLFLEYWLIINLITFLLFAIDKWKAKRNRWRIPERVLLGFSFIGGAVGGLIGMRLCHHKTQKKRFFIGVPMMLVLQILFIIWLIKRT